MRTETFKKKVVLTILAGLFLCGIYVMIFLFSADSAEESSYISQKVTKALVHLYYQLFGSGGGQMTVTAAYEGDALEGMIRKLAHFTEYMTVGFLSFGIAVMWIKKVSAGFGMVLLQLIISAGLDEFHQYFVPGRYASVKDVLIDTAGGTVGMLLLFGIWKIHKRKTHKSK